MHVVKNKIRIKIFLEHHNLINSQSTIHYMELVNKNPDSEETMLRVVGNIVETSKSGACQYYIVIAGDSKTVTHFCT